MVPTPAGREADRMRDPQLVRSAAAPSSSTALCLGSTNQNEKSRLGCDLSDSSLRVRELVSASEVLQLIRWFVAFVGWYSYRLPARLGPTCDGNN